jgi:hypothetical protein
VKDDLPVCISRRVENISHRGWWWDWFPMLAQRFDMKDGRFADELSRLIERIAAGNTARQVRQICRITSIGRSLNDNDVFHIAFLILGRLAEARS